MDEKPESKNAINLKNDIAKLTSNDNFLIVLCKLNGQKIDSWVAVNNFRVNDYPIVRNTISQMIYEMHESEQKKFTETTQQQKIKTQELELKNLLENM